MKSSLLSKAGAVLEAVCRSEHPVAIKELTGVLEMPLPTISRLCADMVEIGLLEKTDYHHLIPGIALIRFGGRARELSPLISALKQPLDDYLGVSGLNAAVFGLDKDSFFTVFHRGGDDRERDILRYTGAFLVLLVSSGLDGESAAKIIERKYPDMPVTEKVICDREIHVISRQKYLTRIAPGRQWMITMPFSYGSLQCALSVYGKGRETRSVEAEMFEVSKVLSRIRTRLDRIGKGEN